jgi:hypothetical protein
MIPHQFNCPHCSEELPAKSEQYAVKRGAIHLLSKHPNHYSGGVDVDTVRRYVKKMNPTIVKLRESLSKMGMRETASDQGRHVNYGWRITERTDHTAIVSILFPVPKRKMNVEKLYKRLDEKKVEDFDRIEKMLKDEGFISGLFLPGYDGEKALGLWVRLDGDPHRYTNLSAPDSNEEGDP